MKISAEILYKELKKTCNFTVAGNVGSEFDYDRPLFLRDGRECMDGQIYIAEEGMVSSAPESKSNSMLLYAGEDPESLLPFFETSFFFKGISVFDLYNVVEKIRMIYGDWDRDLREIAGGSRDVQKMLDRSVPVFNNPLVLYDHNLSTLASAKDFTDDFSAVSLMQRKKLADYASMVDFDEYYSKQKAAFFTPCTAGVRSLYINVFRQGRAGCRLMLFEISRKFNPSDTPLLEHLANMIQDALAESPSADADSATALAYILKNILIGEYQDAAFVEQRLGEYGWKKEQHFVCLKVSADSREPGNLTLHAMGDKVKEKLGGAAVFEYDGSIAVFLNLGASDQNRDSAASPLALLLEEESLRAGMSFCFTGFDGLGRYYRQAGIALCLGRTHRADQRLCRFEDVQEFHLLESCTRELPAHMVCAPEIIKLREYDMAHTTSYFHTLEIFLKNNLHPVQTIKELQIHRSTLIYRLERIQKITGFDVERRGNQWFLLLSFKLLEAAG
jgi:hypothetical protein